MVNIRFANQSISLAGHHTSKILSIKLKFYLFYSLNVLYFGGGSGLANPKEMCTNPQILARYNTSNTK